MNCFIEPAVDVLVVDEHVIGAVARGPDLWAIVGFSDIIYSLSGYKTSEGAWNAEITPHQ